MIKKLLFPCCSVKDFDTLPVAEKILVFKIVLMHKPWHKFLLRCVTVAMIVGGIAIVSGQLHWYHVAAALLMVLVFLNIPLFRLFDQKYIIDMIADMIVSTRDG